MQGDTTILLKAIANSYDLIATTPQLRFAQQLPLHRGAMNGQSVIARKGPLV